MHECDSKYRIRLKFLVSHVESIAILRLDDDARIMAYNLKTINSYSSICYPDLSIHHSIALADIT